MMRAAINLVRSQFSRKFNMEVVDKLAHPHIDTTVPKCRFVQYTRIGEIQNRHHLAMVSEDGAKMMPLSDVCCASPDMVEFIAQRYDMEQLMNSMQESDIIPITNNIRILPPILQANKIIGVEHNYRDYCEEQEVPVTVPKQPSFFMKAYTAVTHALGCIHMPRYAKRVDYANELAVVIGKKAKNVPVASAFDFVFGYLIAQDITACDFNVRNAFCPNLISKSMDTFCPLGPVIVHKHHIPDPHNLWIRTYVNGEERQSSNTRNMIFPIDYIIHRLSHFVTLLPGDVILTGTPTGTGSTFTPHKFLKSGDIIESQIENLGRMKNKVLVV